MRKLSRTTMLAALALGILPALASAHVTLQPAEAPAGEFTRLDVRVPNERDDASTAKVQMKFPPGFIFISHEPVPGWDTQVKMVKLDEPVEVFGERQTERVDTVTFTAQGDGVQPGQFQDFGLSLRMPEEPGTLTFKALQTYSSGEVVRWIGPPDAEEPAPQVELTAAADESAAEPTDPTAPAAAAVDDDSGDDEEDDGNGLAVVALIVGGLGLALGLAGVLSARRARRTA
ncbi:MAG TPA: YcnI family protein [Thermoleophilaceae bacterium]|nr:YcnI family protein [Thermoleophilaceae bacterium]